MKKSLLIAFATMAIFQSVFAQSVEDRKDRIVASYLIAFGILPADGETNYWISDPLSLRTVTDLVNEHKKNISNNESLADRAIRNSYQDAFGRAPEASEYSHWRQAKLSYIELMENHMRFLREYPSEFSAVIKRSYRSEFNREPQNVELMNWKNAGVRSYLSIVQQHQKNKRAGMFATNKSSSQKIISNQKSGVQFEPSIKISNELNQFAASKVISTGGGNVISTGGGNVISTGGGNVISTGGGNVISTGGGN